jgi:hypothetical protein
MGQYHKTFNLDAKEFINPHKLGDGAKLMEQCGWSPGGTNDALALLLAVSSGRGGGDFPSGDGFDEWVGRWGGQRIAVIGDYAEKGDITYEDGEQVDCDAIYAATYGEDGDEDEGEKNFEAGQWTDITDDLRPFLAEAHEVAFLGVGSYGVQRVALNRAIKGWEYSHRVGDSRVAKIEGVDYPIRDLIKALEKRGRLARDEQVSVGELLPDPSPETTSGEAS